MKAVLALGALAALFQSVFALEGGTYTIGSAALPADVVLMNVGPPPTPLGFDDKNIDPRQYWFFSAIDTSGRNFLIRHPSGAFINCGNEPGSPCVSGRVPEIYTVERVADNSYELISRRTGYFLRADGENLQLAEWNNNPDEQFILTRVEW